MLSSQLKDFDAATTVLRQCIVASDCACSIAHDPVSSALSENLAKLGSPIPARPDWLVFNHCANLTRLYAIFSGFVENALQVWLRELPTIYKRYNTLPAVLQDQHKAGVARLLPKVGKGRFKQLTAVDILRGIYCGVSLESEYDLPVKAYLIEDRNLRANVLGALFQRVDLPRLWEWIGVHAEMLTCLGQAYGNQQTAEALLNTLVDYRNDAAHGFEVAEVLSEQEQVRLAEFVTVLGDVVAEFIEFNYWQLRCKRNSALVIGRITEYYRKPDAFIAVVGGADIQVGQTVVALEEQRCRRVTIESLQENGKPIERFRALGEVEVGIKFNDQLKLTTGTRLIDHRPCIDQSRFLGENI